MVGRISFFVNAGLRFVTEICKMRAFPELAVAAAEKRVHVVGLSILSGSHLPLVVEVMARLKDAGINDVPVVVGGIIPPQDAKVLKQRKPASPRSIRRRASN